jgi:hypothetical protein
MNSNEQTMATTVVCHENTFPNIPTQTTTIPTETGPKQVKGGTFATADMELLKRALVHYKDMLVQSEESERNASEELIKVANLLHRIGRIA